MGSKLTEIYKLDESVVDQNVRSGSPQQALKAIGINKNEVKTPADLQSALFQMTRMYVSAMAGLQAKMKTGGVGIEDINPAIVKVAEEAVVAMKKLSKTPATDPAKVTATKPRPQEDPATGYSDDPNPKTRNSKFPGRSYRAG